MVIFQRVKFEDSAQHWRYITLLAAPVTHVVKPIGPSEFHGQGWDHIHQGDSCLSMASPEWYCFGAKLLPVTIQLWTTKDKGFPLFSQS